MELLFLFNCDILKIELKYPYCALQPLCYSAFKKCLKCPTLFLIYHFCQIYHFSPNVLSPLLFALLTFDPAIMVHKISLENMQSMLNESSSHSY